MCDQFVRNAEYRIGKTVGTIKLARVESIAGTKSRGERRAGHFTCRLLERLGAWWQRPSLGCYSAGSLYPRGAVPVQHRKQPRQNAPK